MPPSNSYSPHPLDTRSIQLPPDLEQVIEQLAKNIHEIWAVQRAADGWTYGPARDDPQRQHPGLVPFNELDDSEKSYDRTVARETVKSLLALGFAIQKREHAP
jgi:hypothetical protein